MHTLPGGSHTGHRPPMAIPLRHVVVAFVFLLAGLGLSLVSVAVGLPGLQRVALFHTFLLGWVCVTIMGAMTQFVPVWSGQSIHSRRLAVAQLWLVTGGLVGFVAAALLGSLLALAIFATVVLAGLWTFVYNVGRTLAPARPFDVTERHFALALCSFALLAPLGWLLALDFSLAPFDHLPVTRANVLFVHVTLALFGAVLPTIVGALAQLSKMFTQPPPSSLETPLFRLETVALGSGVGLFALGRGLEAATLARLGAGLVLVALLAATAVLVRNLVRASAASSPMTRRYWVVACSLALWGVLTAVAWAESPLEYGTLAGHEGARPLLFVGVFGFVVVGTLYHIVPFIVWHERYSDRLGLEPVPMIDDLYSSRLERAEYVASVAGLGALAAGSLFSLPESVSALGLGLFALGATVFVCNAVGTIHRHSPGGVRGLFLGSGDETGAGERTEDALETS
ncbi:heme-copper oxidase family protein [Natronobiforma cellulositropha]|uniref:hypothetical protein n=1 Tax=Natronobiforma cellulositropha TaxID=1679076 RepID=UPI0021D5C9B8|nr:hypothetical protein [Natronobiforma cellulositropha]